MGNRVFYACHAVGINGGFVTGAQSVGVTTTFDLEPVFQLGQLTQIDTITLAPQAELTLTRAIVGGTYYQGTYEEMFTGDENRLQLSVGDDAAPLLVAPSSNIECTGAGLSGVTFNFPVDGVFTEELTYLARGKRLSGSVSATKIQDAGVPTRQFFVGGAPGLVTSAGNLTNVTISCSPGRTMMYKLGRYDAFHSYVNNPGEVNVEFEVSATGTDGVDIPSVAACESPSFGGQDISLSLCGSTFAMEKCRLSNVAYGGGDTGGGNATITFTYTTYNSLTVG